MLKTLKTLKTLVIGGPTVDTVIADFRRIVESLNDIREAQMGEVETLGDEIARLAAERAAAVVEAERAGTIARRLGNLIA